MKTKQTIGLFLLTISTGLFFGCATLTGGSSQEVSFNSNPEGANVSIDGKVIGKTPLKTRLSSKKANQSLVFEKSGHETVTMKMDTKTNPMFWGNILIGGLPGTTTDSLSGAIYEYSPNKYMVTMEPGGTGALDSSTSKSLAQKTVDFIVIGHNSILKDLSRGDGPHLASLLKMLNIPKHQQTEAASNLLALANTHSDIPRFAGEVVRLYL